MHESIIAWIRTLLHKGGGLLFAMSFICCWFGCFSAACLLTNTGLRHTVKHLGELKKSLNSHSVNTVNTAFAVYADNYSKGKQVFHHKP